MIKLAGALGKLRRVNNKRLMGAGGNFANEPRGNSEARRPEGPRPRPQRRPAPRPRPPGAAGGPESNLIKLPPGRPLGTGDVTGLGPRRGGGGGPGPGPGPEN